MMAAAMREPSEGQRGAWPMWVTVGAVLLLPVVIWCLSYWLTFTGLTSGDAMDYGQIGRNLISGRGYSTSILRPLLMGAGPVRGVLPETTHPPLYPALLALGFGVAGARDIILVGASGLGYILTAWLLVWAGRKLISLEVGLAASILYCFHARAIESSLSGLPNGLASAGVLALFLLLITLLVDYEGDDEYYTEGSAYRLAFSAGVMVGFLGLIDSALAWLALPVLMSFRTGVKARAAGLARFALLGCALILLPWWIWVGYHSGNPFQGGRGWELVSLGRVPSEVLYRSSAAQVWNATPNPGAFFMELFNTGQRVLSAGAGLLGAALLGCFAASLAWPMVPQIEGVRRVGLALCATGMLAALWAPSSVVSVQAVLPVMVLLSVAFLFGQLDRGCHPGLVAMAGATVLLFCAVPFTPALRARGSADPNVGLRYAASRMGQRVGQEEAVLSDQPWMVAWYARRSSVWIPTDERLLDPASREKLNLRWAFLSPNVRQYSGEWSELYQVLHAWNEKHGREWARQSIKSGLVSVKGNDQSPLMQRLNGLTLMPVPETVATGAVVAGFPKELRKGLEERRKRRTPPAKQNSKLSHAAGAGSM